MHGRHTQPRRGRIARGCHRALLGAALIASAGCKAKTEHRQAKASASAAEPEGPDSPAKTEAVAVATYNCKPIADDRGRRCYFGEARELLLWLPAGEGEDLRGGYELRFDGQPLAAETRLSGEDLVVAVEIPGPGELELELESGARWSTQLVALSNDYRALVEALNQRFMSEGPEPALAELASARATLDADEAALLGCFEVQASYGTARLPALASELADSPAIGCRGLAHVLMAYTHIYDAPDFNAARVDLERAREAGRSDYEIGLGALHQRSSLALAFGEVDEAIDTLERAVELAAQLDNPAQRHAIELELAVAAARIGRFERAEALLELDRELRDSPAKQALAAELLDIVSWVQLLLREHDGEVEDPSPALIELEQLYATLDRPNDVHRVRLHLALAASQAGACERGEELLARVETEQLTPVELFWYELIAARCDRQRRRFDEADVHLERAALLAELNEDPELGWWASTAAAKLARAAGRSDEALAAYARAATLADRLALSVPGTAGRSMAVTSRSRVDAEHVELLLELGRKQDAFCVAAGTRARHLRSLWARLRPPLSAGDQQRYRALLSRHARRQREIEARLDEAWSLSKAELEALRDEVEVEGARAGEILDEATALLERQAPRWDCAALTPTDPGLGLLTMIADPERTRWWFMLARAERPPEIVELDGVDPDALAAQALAALAPALAELDALTVIPVAEFVSVDVHRAVLAHEALAGLEVQYSLGLGHVDGAAEARAREASVIAGATNLDAVRREADLVRTQLEARSWTVRSSWAARGPQPTLLHYAGHGHHEGLAGWDSYIELPGHGRLSATQIVAEQRAPAWVVLGACSAGETNAQIIDGGMNLAAAFLLAGADLVIAPSGPVDDATAVALARALYRGDAPLDAAALRHQLAAVQGQELSQAEPPAGPRSTLRWRAWIP